MDVQLLSAATATNSPPVATAEVLTITTVASSALVDGERVLIRNGGATRIFEFDDDGEASIAGSLLIDMSAGLTANQVRDALITAINAAGLDVVATSGGAATVTVTANRNGPGTIFASETVTDGTFACAITPGTLSGVALGRTPTVHPRITDDIATIFVRSTAGSATMSVTIRLWGYAVLGGVGAWYPIGPGITGSADSTRGVLNNGQAIGEIASDKIAHSEQLYGLTQYDRIYAEIVAIGGTSTAITAWLGLRS